MNSDHDLERLLASCEAIPRVDVLNWMRECDREVRGRTYAFLEKACRRVKPPLSALEYGDFAMEYLLDCVAADPEPTSYLHSGYEAAWELAAWFRKLDVAGEDDILARTARELERVYLTGDEATRQRILNGAIEHIFERTRCRRYFARWTDHPELRAAYSLAADWADDHPE